MSDETKISIANTHVPDKLYGYGLQVRQMLFELLNCEINSVVSVEKFDDIGIENGKEKTAIQTKSALSNRNPVSDRAIDLWKTLYNWLLALKENELPIGFTLFTLVINVNKSGNIVTWLNQARNEKEAEVEYKKIYHSVGAEEVIDAILSAGGIPVLAHPMESLRGYDEESVKKLIGSLGIRHIEFLTPKHTAEEVEMLERIIIYYDLSASIGSDTHKSVLSSIPFEYDLKTRYFMWIQRFL